MGRLLLLKALLILVVVLYADRFPADPSHVAPREGDAADVAWILARGFDCTAYQQIAAEGYASSYNRVFPPLFPLAIRVAALAASNFQVAASLVANLASIVALILFVRLVRRRAVAGSPAARRGAAAVMLFSVMPGVLAFGTVAYSEALFLALSIGAWLAWEKAVVDSRDRGAARAAAWLLLSSVLGVLCVLTRHLGLALPLALTSIQLVRGVRAPAGRRGRAWLEAGLVAAGLAGSVAYLAWKVVAHDAGLLHGDIFDVRFVPLGGPVYLVGAGTLPTYVGLTYYTAPVAAFLLWKLFRVDRPLFVFAVIALLLGLSFTGVSAQAFNRYAWTAWPLALGALRIGDRAVSVMLAAFLGWTSLWLAVAHVMGVASM